MSEFGFWGDVMLVVAALAILAVAIYWLAGLLGWVIG